ncbi:hypothetical protein BLA6863_01502 [Burkholderia lata]|uniref:Uncharacterized protein n=1 Tax=Burkholderia lata (strain ATCC 17760 / DSM 23089 / LMG 22485 / NCIMB 9086 / R18194 / 383) TaxID=482957 RepID=A0A6P2IWZ7_BURL3|nr:hypothetical protein BLA6863_01502 [Burkholderia lata]
MCVSVISWPERDRRATGLSGRERRFDARKRGFDWLASRQPLCRVAVSSLTVGAFQSGAVGLDSPGNR